MRARVGQKVDEDLVDTVAVRHNRGAAGRFQRPLVFGRGHPGIVDSILREFGDIDSSEVEFQTLVKPRQQKQVFHESRHPNGLGFDSIERMAKIGAHIHVLSPGEFGVSANCREWGPEFVTGIGDKLSNLRLAVPAGG